jgi:hypothetical protein
MAGLGKTTFVAGTILTASQVNGYLMDQAVQVYAGTAARGSAIAGSTTEGMMTYLSDTNSVQMATGTATFVNVDSLPIVAGTAARDALYPVPTAGNTVFRTDTGVAESYYAAYSTAVPGGRDTAGWYATSRVDGLVPVRPTSVTVAGAGSSASFTSLGQLTFATATKITVNDIFSSQFTNYRAVLSGFTSGTLQIQYRYTVAGVETSANYSYTQVACATTDAAPARQAGSSSAAQGFIGFMVATNNTNAYSFDVIDPQVAAYTKFVSKGFYSTSVMTDTVGVQAATTQFDGMSLFPTSGTFTGTLSVYGYNK